MKIAIIGCGAMGSIYAGLMADAGYEVWAVDVWEEHIKTIQQQGLRVEGASGDRTVKVNATTNAADVGPCDLVIVATKAAGVEMAAKAAVSLCRPDTIILTIQNGLGAAERIAQSIDTSQVMIGVVGGFGASMKGPAHAHHNGMQQVRIGEMNGGVSERLEKVVEVWSTSGFNAKGYPDIHQMIWEKFICNVTYSGPSTVTGMRLGQIIETPDAWAIASGCAKEADAVARAKGIDLGFEDVETYVRDFGMNIPNSFPSMQQDHAAGRKSEIDAINGIVPVQAATVGLEAPMNLTVASIIRARESLFD